jgi:hypothetical protein
VDMAPDVPSGTRGVHVDGERADAGEPEDVIVCTAVCNHDGDHKVVVVRQNKPGEDGDNEGKHCLVVECMDVDMREGVEDSPMKEGEVPALRDENPTVEVEEAEA